AARCDGHCVASQAWMGLMADFPTQTASQIASTVRPAPHTAPVPVMRMRDFMKPPDAETPGNCSIHRTRMNWKAGREWGFVWIAHARSGRRIRDPLEPDWRSPGRFHRGWPERTRWLLRRPPPRSDGPCNFLWS